MQRPVAEVWERILALAQEAVNANAFVTWFKPILPLKLEDKNLTIQVPSQFYYEWLEQHYSHILHQALARVLGPGAKLLYSILVAEQSAKAEPLSSVRSISRPTQNLDNLNVRYTFDSFIEGECNKFAKAASLAVAKSPGKTTFNPLVVYGGVGLGKTHLIEAVGNYAKAEYPQTRVLYVDSEQIGRASCRERV